MRQPIALSRAYSSASSQAIVSVAQPPQASSASRVIISAPPNPGARRSCVQPK